MRLLVDPSDWMVGEALAILAILASHQDGRATIYYLVISITLQIKYEEKQIRAGC